MYKTLLDQRIIALQAIYKYNAINVDDDQGFGTEDWRLWYVVPATYSPHQLQRSCLQPRCSRSVWLYSSFDIGWAKTRLFVHIVRSDPMLDHHRALRIAIQRPPASWRRPKGRSRLTWTRVIECDLCPTVPGLHSVWHRAQHRSDWRSLVETATLQ